MPPNKKRLLIYAPVPLFRRDKGFLLEDQACNGLRLWAENFDHVSVLMPVDPGVVPPNWCPIEDVGPALDRIDIIPLPMAYRPDQFLKAFRATRQIIRDQIQKADYLSFSIGGLFGDWGSVACYEAYKMGRRFAVWTDRVESEVVRRTMHVGPLRRRIRARLTYLPMAWLERFLIRRAALGLFHGRETYETYAPFCQNPHIVHDIHIKKSEHIDPEALQDKADRAGAGPLKIIYAGRADPMKGGLDWIQVLQGLSGRDVNFEAIWLGDGPDLPEMKCIVAEEGFEDRVVFPGFVKERSDLLQELREATVFLFCHKTPESPRCLIEALVSGTPIVGYDGAFARDLISEQHGGHLVELNDTEALVDFLCKLNAERDALGQLIKRAALSGDKFDDEEVFRHRSEIIYQNLS